MSVLAAHLEDPEILAEVLDLVHGAIHNGIGTALASYMGVPIDVAARAAGSHMRVILNDPAQRLEIEGWVRDYLAGVMGEPRWIGTQL